MDNEDDKSYNSDSEEDIDLNADKNIEEDKNKEEEASMPLKRAPRKAAQKANDVVETVTESIASMAIAQSKKSMAASCMWSMDFVFPFMVKQFLHNARQSCTVDLLVPTIHEDKVRPRVVGGGDFLAVSVCVPDFFPEEERVLVAAGNEDFNTNQAAAHSEVVQEIRKHYNEEIETIGSPQMIKLPFKCEEQIVAWHCDLYHGDAEVSGLLGEQQYFSVLRVDLVSIKQVQHQRNRGTMRVVGSLALVDHRAAAANNNMQP